MNCLGVFAFLVPLLSLLAAAGSALIALGQAHRPPLSLAASDAAERPTARIALATSALALLVLLAIDVASVRDGVPGKVLVGRWFAFVDIGFALDAAALAFATLIALVGFVTLRFSINYLHREPGFHRFFAAMSLFLAGMQLIALGGNAVLVFVGWELAGLSSFLLIGYAWDRGTATENAQYAFVANRIGDAGFLLAIALAWLWLGTVEWSGITAPHLDPLTARLMALGFVVAALAKSGQVPFSPWIMRALEGPTSSSAIFYGAVMVHAGVWLVIRLEPLLTQVPDVMVMIAVLGALGAVAGALSGLAQSDVKSALLAGTLTQVGLMFVACGLGYFGVATLHLLLHAAFRAWQFLMAPSLMHRLPGPARPAPTWLAERRGLYAAAIQRFWLDPVLAALLIRPIRTMGEDARRLDEELLGPLAGAPAALPMPKADVDSEATVLESPGAVGRLLMRFADTLRAFEARLVWQGGDGPLTRSLREFGAYLRAAEALLEEPRYLLVLVLATFVVIL
jgi:NADH:ubiquinone oxidoreductase subunit 5 (subunit L)/multisubunit Na+/H+ antiporter MnhA subunit